MKKITILIITIITATAFCKPAVKDIKTPPRAFVITDSLIFSDQIETDINSDGKPDNWILHDNVSIDTSISMSGASMKITGDGQNRTKAISKNITIEPQKSYHLSWWCRTESVARYVSVSVNTGDRSIEFETEYQGNSREWLYHECIFTSKDTETACKIAFQLISGTSWIDDVILKRYEKPLDSSDVIHECARILYKEGDSAAVWVNYPVTKIFREDLLSPTLYQADTIKIRMAKNEYEAFQLVFHPAQEIPYISVHASDLIGPVTITSEYITINTVHYVWINEEYILDPTARVGYHPDALPWENASTAPADLHTPFWITVKTPTDIPAGTYTGKITVSGSLKFEFPIKIHVWDFALPIIPSLNIRASDVILHSPKIEFYDDRSSKERFEDFANNLTSHRVMGTRYVAAKLNDENWLEIIEDSMHIDFSVFDETVQEYFEFGFQNFLLPPYSLAASSRPLGQTSWLGLIPLTEEFNQFFKNYCIRIGAHLAERGWLDRAFLMMWDEPSTQEYSDLYELYSLVRKADPRLKLALTEEPIPELYDVVDIWYPNLRRVSINEITDRVYEQQTAGKVVGGYGNNRYSMLYPLTYQRLWPWTLKKYGLTHTGWWSVLSESRETSVWENPVITIPETIKTNKIFPGHAFFIYFDPEGSGRFVNSIRWEALRDGAEDYEYLAELESRVEAVSHGTGQNTVQTLIDSLVWDNIGELFDPSMARLAAIRDSIGFWIESLDNHTSVYDKTTDNNNSKQALKTEITCFPNPFNTSTSIYLQPSSSTIKSFFIYDIMGRKIRTLINENNETTGQIIIWNGCEDSGSPAASGIYILVCEHENGISFHRVALVR